MFDSNNDEIITLEELKQFYAKPKPFEKIDFQLKDQDSDGFIIDTELVAYSSNKGETITLEQA